MEILETKYKNSRGDLFEIYVSPPERTEQTADLNYVVFFRINKPSRKENYIFTVKMSDFTYATWGRSSGKSPYNILKVLGLLRIKRNLELNSFSENEYILTKENTQDTFEKTIIQLEEEIDKIKSRKPLSQENKNINLRGFRIKILQLHYNQSNANQYNPVLRTEIAKELNMDHNSEGLLKTLKFLEDKGFLKMESNIEDSITTDGIDEVENDFPNLKKGERENIEDSEEILKLSPEFYGIGINLKNLFHKVKKFFNK